MSGFACFILQCTRFLHWFIVVQAVRSKLKQIYVQSLKTCLESVIYHGKHETLQICHNYGVLQDSGNENIHWCIRILKDPNDQIFPDLMVLIG